MNQWHLGNKATVTNCILSRDLKMNLQDDTATN